MQQHRVLWEPYVNDDPSVMVDITGLTGRALIRAIGVSASIADAEHIATLGQQRRPFNDPRLGCLSYA